MPELKTGVIELRDDLRAVQAVFEKLVDNRPERRIGFAAYDRGERVALLDSHGAGNDLVTMYSTGKGPLAVTVGLLIADGTLDPNAPVARYWPEFAAGDKESVTIAQLMSHQAGLVNVSGGFTVQEMLAHEPLARRLAAQRPWWPPGSTHGYHVLTWGTLVDELVRRTTGRTAHELFRDRVAGPRGIDVHLLLDPATEARTLPTRAPATDELPFAGLAISPDALLGRALNLGVPGFPSPTELSEIPGARTSGPVGVAGAASADGLARLYASIAETVDGREPLFDGETSALLTGPLVVGPDAVLPAETGFALGFETSPRPGRASVGDWFGHGGLGGSGGSCVPSYRTSFGFTTDHMPPGGGRDDDEQALRSAVLSCLEPADTVEETWPS